MKIANLSSYLKKLSLKDKKLFDRFFTTSTQTGKLVLPKEMELWAKKTFGSLSAVKKQKIVNILNNFTFEGALYNEFRAKRPMNYEEVDLKQYEKHDIFHDPLTSTPMDTFGRIEGPDEVTAANIAKYDDKHGLVIFDKFNPLRVTKKELENHFITAINWLGKAHSVDKKAVYPVILWNCLFKAASSIVHGHMQTLLADIPYGRIGRKNQIVQEYKKKYKTNYFDDLFYLHDKLGLATKYKDSKIYVNLTAAKEKETVILCNELNTNSIDATFFVIEAFKKLGVNSFNVFTILKPYEKTSWNLPVIIRIVDRGSISSKTSDVGALELFTQHAVIGSDPYKVIKEIKKQFK